MSWLRPLKPIAVVAVLGCIAYVVYIFTTSVPPVAPPGATPMVEIPDIDKMANGVPTEFPTTDAPADATPGGAAPAWTPGPANSASTDGSPSFGDPISPILPPQGGPTVDPPDPTAGSTAPVSTSGDFAPPVGDFTANTPLTDNAAPEAAIFSAGIAQAEQLLSQNQLARALQHLSAMRSSSTQLTPAQRTKLNALLDQVAGTVIYSREHRLLKAHIVALNESLDTIATQYNVPAGLLAKINGIGDPNSLKPGDELKVVQGPFHAVVDLAAGELTLMLDGQYAGRFPVAIAGGVQEIAGNYVVRDKPGFHNLQLVPQAVGAPGVGNVVIGANDPRVALRLRPKDAEDVSSILSTGSNVVIR